MTMTTKADALVVETLRIIDDGRDKKPQGSEELTQYRPSISKKGTFDPASAQDTAVQHQLIQSSCFRIPLCQHTLPYHSTLDEQYSNDHQALVLPRCRIDDVVKVASSAFVLGSYTRPNHHLSQALLLS